MKVKFFDLKVNNKKDKILLNASFNKLLAHGKFFLGPEVSKLEKKNSYFFRSKICNSSWLWK